MDSRYEAFMLADPLWYEPLERCQDEDSLLGLVTRDLPGGWHRRRQNVWIGLHPDDAGKLPDQGWKIHVTAAPETLEETVEAVWAVCRSLRLPWKFLRSRAVTLKLNTKYASRASSGKAVTVYPRSEQELRTALDALDQALSGKAGPYVLSDLRWRKGPASVRYGAFTALWCELKNGTRVPALRNPDGALVPDMRRPVFTVPEWVEVPDFLRDQQTDTTDGLLGGYRVTKALHFSNAGGVYVAEGPDGRQVVLKEARPGAGLDKHGVDAVERLHREHEVLTRLAHLPFVPEVFGLFTEWEHHYLAMEYVQGETFSAWVGKNAPAIRHRPDEASRRAFADEVLRVTRLLAAHVSDLHAEGIAFGDLHPHNVMIRPDGAVALIDFELAGPVDTPRTAALGAPGFMHTSITSPRDADLFALGCCQLAPLTSMTGLISRTPEIVAHLLAMARQTYPSLPSAYFDEIVERLALAPALPPGFHAPRPLAPLEPDTLVRGITEAATPERDDRLYPGDISLYAPGGPLGLANGAPGVLLALQAVGAPIPQVHVDWLVQAVRRAPKDVPLGLYDGLAGAAWVLHLLGHPEAADVVDRILDASPPDSPGLLSGRTGIAHLFLSAGLKDEALQLARTVAERVGEPGLLDLPGLMRGWSGPAVLLSRCAGLTGDPAWQEAAERCIRQDLRHGRMADGMLQMHSSNRLLPYLAEGTAGVALAALSLPGAPGGSAELQRVLDGAARAAAVQAVAQGGLFHGRAGLLYLLSHLSDREPGRRPDVDAHVRALALYATPVGDAQVMSGDQLMRLSTDLATGSAGVLLALAAATGPERRLLPGAHADIP